MRQHAHTQHDYSRTTVGFNQVPLETEQISKTSIPQHLPVRRACGWQHILLARANQVRESWHLNSGSLMTLLESARLTWGGKGKGGGSLPAGLLCASDICDCEYIPPCSTYLIFRTCRASCSLSPLCLRAKLSHFCTLSQFKNVSYLKLGSCNNTTLTCGQMAVVT